jgi:hypothetical protein
MEQANANGAVKRIHRTEEEILKLLEEQEESGFTVKDFCELSEINEQTFNSWIRKYRKSEEEKGFTTIEIVPSREQRSTLFAEVGGIKLYKEVSADYLKALIA